MSLVTTRNITTWSGTWVFCFLYTLLYLPENFGKRAHWVLSPDVFYPTGPQELDLPLRFLLAFVIAFSVTFTVFLGSLLYNFTEDPSVSMKKQQNNVQQTSISVLLKEYSLLIITSCILYSSIYFICLLEFQNGNSLAHSIASKFFVEGCGSEFAWITSGFYTSVFALSFFHPFETKKSYHFSNRLALMLASIGGFGGMAGVGGVCVIIIADFIDIFSTLVSTFLTNFNLIEYVFFVSFSIFGSYCFFFGLGITLHIIYYIQQKNTPENWKCQPKRWLTFVDHRHEILLGTCNITIASILAGSISYKIYKNQWTLIYFMINEYGYIYLLSSLICLFFYTEVIAYYIHRTFHTRFLYKNFHKWHHRYKAPTAFAALAIHPCEYACYQFFLLLPIFIVPIHFAVYGFILIYLYYFGMVDHSGIKFTSIFPWQPSSLYHDDHHKYFHCNFGQNTILFDYLHQTLRKVNSSYGEHKFIVDQKNERIQRPTHKELVSYH